MPVDDRSLGSDRAGHAERIGQRLHDAVGGRRHDPRVPAGLVVHAHEFVGLGPDLVDETRQHPPPDLGDLIDGDAGDLVQELRSGVIRCAVAAIAHELEAHGTQAPPRQLGVAHEPGSPRLDRKGEDRCP